jgi:hypothetical protein
VLIHALAASCEELRARTGNPPLRSGIINRDNDLLKNYIYAICGTKTG